MDASAYAFTYGVRRTRGTLRAWRQDRWRILGRWAAGSAVAAFGLLAAVLVVSALSSAGAEAIPPEPPFAVGNLTDVPGILGHNLLVLALHAMACVAGFIAGSSLPLQADSHHGISRWVHERGGRIAIAFVVCATTFSLSAQAYLLGDRLAAFSHELDVPAALLLLAVLPHAVPELMALFLPLAAWIMASRRGEWDQLLAATLVTVAVAIPVLIAAALVEVYISPHLFHTFLGSAHTSPPPLTKGE
jgi:Stage II sporulation protein M